MESPHDTNRLDLGNLLVALFTWSLIVKFSLSVMPKNLTVETFVRIDS